MLLAIVFIAMMYQILTSDWGRTVCLALLIVTAVVIAMIRVAEYWGI